MDSEVSSEHFAQDDEGYGEGEEDEDGVEHELALEDGCVDELDCVGGRVRLASDLVQGALGPYRCRLLERLGVPLLHKVGLHRSRHPIAAYQQPKI